MCDLGYCYYPRVASPPPPAVLQFYWQVVCLVEEEVTWAHMAGMWSLAGFFTCHQSSI